MEAMKQWPQEVVILFDGDTVFSEKIPLLFSLLDNRFKNVEGSQSLIGGMPERFALPDFFTATRDEEDEHSRLFRTGARPQGRARVEAVAQADHGSSPNDGCSPRQRLVRRRRVGRYAGGQS